jgi:hypothetical protein
MPDQSLRSRHSSTILLGEFFEIDVVGSVGHSNKGNPPARTSPPPLTRRNDKGTQEHKQKNI